MEISGRTDKPRSLIEQYNAYLKDLYLNDCPAIPTFHTSALESIQFEKSVSIYLTHKCNLNCKTCYINANKPLQNELNTNDFVKIFAEIKDLDFPMVYFLGGEPLIRKDIFELISMAKKNGLYVSMSSNGYFINSGVAEKLKNSGLDQIQISIDSADEKTNDFIRGKGSFKRATYAIQSLIKYGVKVSIGFTITSFYSNVKEMISLAERLNVKVLNISVAEQFGRALPNNAVPSKNQVREAVESILNLKTKLKLTFNGFRFYLDEKYYEGIGNTIPIDYRSCPAGTNRFVIDSNGNVFGCELLMYDQFVEGNVRNENISDIWKNGFKIFKHRDLPEECKICPYRKICQGGCPARAYLKGSFNERDILCDR